MFFFGPHPPGRFARTRVPSTAKVRPDAPVYQTRLHNLYFHSFSLLYECCFTGIISQRGRNFPLPRMDHPKANINPSTDISPANPEEEDLERNSDIAEDVEISTATKELHTSQERNGVENTPPAPKKSLSFKLAFAGLAASLFVFQVDATCLGIALPVSLHTFPILCCTRQ